MNTKISKISQGSIAEEVDIEVGDILISINGTPVKDIIDYKFLMADEYIEIEIEKKDGEIWSIEIEKEYDEDLGIEFENQILDEARSCCNKCMFCFIDQLPKGMRESLYFKDDDSRLSFLQGNFVTLTNMKDEDIDRIIRYRISPINISVHTTNPELRVKMLNNRFAGNIMERLKKLADAGISMNCQVVSCPGINNGEELIRTVDDLYKLYPSIENIAVVPVGITKYREGLAKLELYNRQNAEMELDNVARLQKKYIDEIGQPFVRLSDEFYVTAGREIPQSDFYGNYEQLEDGIGMIRIFRDSVENSIEELNANAKGSFTLVTGSSAYNEIFNAAEKITNKNNGIKLKVKKIINHHFGETITVAGLITGNDVIDQLRGEEINEYIIIPVNMLKSGEEVFLDDVTIEDIEKELKRQVIVCDYTGEDLINRINEFSKEE